MQTKTQDTLNAVVIALIWSIAALLFILLGVTGVAHADRSEFEQGFEEGYKSVRGDYAYVPYAPISVIKPYNKTDFENGIQQGYERGMADEERLHGYRHDHDHGYGHHSYRRY